MLAEQSKGLQVGVAKTLDLDQTHVSRLLRRKTTTLSLESCLRLTRACDLDPDLVTTPAGKGELGSNIRHLYEAAAVRQFLAADEGEWPLAFRALGPEHRKAMLSVAKGLLEP